MTAASYSYAQIEQSLIAMQAEVSPEEMHGLMTGWLCVNFNENKDWQTLLFPELEVDPQLAAVFEKTAVQLDDSELRFQLLLPQDDAPLVERGEALTNWCQGFLAGIGLTGLNIAGIKEIQEPIQDLSEIAKLDYLSLNEEDKEDQSAFEEVAEYVRVSVMLIYTEVFGKKHKSNDSSEALH